jgi:hypothetical protein
MIDPDWLQRMLILAEADTGGIEARSLAVLLAEPEEVLPYLFVHARGFAAWPQARAALAQAAASAVRHVPGETDRQRRLPGASPDRDALYAALHAALPPGDGARAEAPGVGETLRLIRTVRLDERRGDDAPSLFIERD